MIIISETAAQLLTTLKEKLSALQDKCLLTPSSSDYSKAMVANLIFIVDTLFNERELGYWRKAAHQNAMLERIHQIDAHRGTFVPEVFNTESRELAKLVQEFLSSVEISTFFPTAALGALSTLLGGDVSRFLTIMRHQLETNLKFYAVLEHNAVQVEEGYKLSQKFQQYFDTLLTPIKALESGETYQFSVDAYARQVEEFIQSTRGIDYVRICNAESFVNAKAPTPKRSDDVVSRGNRGLLIWQLIVLEMDLNKKLAEKNPSLVHHVYTHYSTGLREESMEKAERELVALFKDFQAEADNYKKGAHLKRFGGLLKPRVNPAKAALVDHLLGELQAEVDKGAQVSLSYLDRTVGIRSFQMYKNFLDAINRNSAIAREERISIGALSTLLNRMGSNFLWLSLNSDELTDRGILTKLELYRENCPSCCATIQEHAAVSP